MNADERCHINERYNKRLLKYGDDIRTLASGTEDHRKIRYQILSEIGLRTGCSILDVGCGFGDFYKYLTEQGVATTYVGYDINQNLLDIARRKYPEAEFKMKDIQLDSFPNFDFIVSSSAFNLRMVKQNNYAFVEDVLKKCFAHAKYGVAVDFLTKYVDFEMPDAFYYSPERLLTTAKKITKCVCLRHDYPLFEFCLYLFPNFQGWRSDEKAEGMLNI